MRRLTAGSMLSLVPFLTALAAPPDEVRMRSLGARGATFRDVYPGVIAGHLAAAGDANGDGLADFLLVRYVEGPDFEGQVLLVYGAPDLPPSPTFTELKARSTVFRRTKPMRVGNEQIETLARLGDMDEDAFEDFLIARPAGALDEGPLPNARPGVVYIVHGSDRFPAEVSLDEPPVGVRITTLTSSKATPKSLCLAATTRGDLNGDGKRDLVLGAGYASTSETEIDFYPGRVYVLFGGAPLVGAIDVEEVGGPRPGVILDGDGDGEGFGRAVEYAGDVNGDGLDDLLVGTVFWRGGAPSSAYVAFGARDFPARLTASELVASGRGVRLDGDSTFAEAGHALQPLGDANADGIDDFLVGAPGHGRDRGAVYLVHGRRQFPASMILDALAADGRGVIFRGVSRDARPPQSLYARAGEALAVLDHDGDGRSDFFIGSPRFEYRGISVVGRAYVVLGQDLAPAERSLAEIEAGQLAGALFTTEVSEWLGATGAAPGDVNGDGHGDLMVSAPFYFKKGESISPGVEGNASVYLVYGPDGGPAPLVLDGVSPPTAPLSGGTEITLRGDGFDASTTVEIGGSRATVKRIETTARLVVEAPAGSALGPVEVAALRGGEVRRLQAALRYVPQHYSPIDVSQLQATLGGTVVRGRSQIANLAFLDWDADGFADLLASQLQSEDVFVVYGRPGAPAEIQMAERGEEIPGDAGLAILQVGAGGPGRISFPIGDVNGDGHTDLAISAPGVVRVLFGGRPRATGVVETADLVLAGKGVNILVPGPFLHQVAGGSDLDGDGVGDLVLSVVDGLAGRGTVHLVRGRREWPAEIFLADAPLLVSSTPEALFGTDVAIPGDVDGDRFGDVLVGAPGRFFRDAGHGYLVFGGSTLAEGTIEELVATGKATQLNAFKPKDSVGKEVCAPGDFNGDGIPDFALSAEGGGLEKNGESYVVFGGRSLAGAPGREPVELSRPDLGQTRITGDQGYDYAFYLAPAGDFNGDGLPDLLVGAAGHRTAPHNFVVFGGPARHVSLGEIGGDGVRIQGDSSLGHYLTGGGDFNGDGVDDVVVGGITRDAPGRVFIVFGRSANGSFIRGDSNRDGRVQIADAVHLLGHLFLGADPPPCLDAADGNDDGKLDLTDAVYVLAHLFLGGLPPPAPFPASGADPTADGLDCGG